MISLTVFCDWCRWDSLKYKHQPCELLGNLPKSQSNMDILSISDYGCIRMAHEVDLWNLVDVQVDTCVRNGRHCRRLGDEGWDGGYGARCWWRVKDVCWDSHGLRLMMEMVEWIDGHHCIRRNYPLASSSIHLGVVPISVGSWVVHLLHHLITINYM